VQLALEAWDAFLAIRADGVIEISSGTHIEPVRGLEGRYLSEQVALVLRNHFWEVYDGWYIPGQSVLWSASHFSDVRVPFPEEVMLWTPDKLYEGGWVAGNCDGHGAAGRAGAC
jgi:hypothetical protein